MFKKLQLALLILGLLSCPVYAAPDLISVEQSSGDVVKMDSIGAWVGDRENIEVVTTSDTITSAESGKTFLINISSGNLTMTLPSAVQGLQYDFVALDGNGVSGQARVIINPQNNDLLVACHGAGPTSFSAGDSLRNNQTTSDAVKLIAYQNGKWACKDIKGTWTDND